MKWAALVALALSGCNSLQQGVAPPLDEAGPAYPSPASLCRTGEEVIFSCRVANGPDISVCARSGTIPATAIFRIAGDGKAEELPRPGGPKGRYSRVTHPGGNEAQIEFRGDDVRMVAFRREFDVQAGRRASNDLNASDGLYAFNDAGLIGYVSCDSGATPIQHELATRNLDHADELFVQSLEAGD